MSTFTLVISCLTTSNLPWFMDLTLQVPMQYCSLQHQTLLLSPVTCTTECWFCFGSVSSFLLELFLQNFSSYFSSIILGTSWPGEFIFQCPIFLPFHTAHGILKAVILKWFSISFSSGPHFVRYPKKMSFHYRGLDCKSRKSRNTWSNRQIWPSSTEWSRAKANRVLPREHTDHGKHPLPTTQEKTLHMDISRRSTPKSDW